ncbi:hypothetical protein QAD02_007024 [Eretmocerus hayati]|uniref:Uncharacterized protein n=1 Tax=Eretmocerus hayati TaxID=131215 RepID=A0ACC2N2W2_9HYME|nr:hypothetical protein QAD02_007024 [Eretmocerus hayati]
MQLNLMHLSYWNHITRATFSTKLSGGQSYYKCESEENDGLVENMKVDDKVVGLTSFHDEPEVQTDWEEEIDRYLRTRRKPATVDVLDWWRCNQSTNQKTSQASCRHQSPQSEFFQRHRL